MRMSMLFPIVALALLNGLVPAQDTAASLLTAARKKAKVARTLEGEDRDRARSEVITLLKSVHERFPSDVAAGTRAWLEIGRMERRRGQFGAAREAFEKVAGTPDQPGPVCDALHDLASLHRKEKRLGDARKCLDRVVKDFPKQGRARTKALLRLAGLDQRAGDLEAAEVAFRKVLDEHPELWRASVDALDRLARMKLRDGYRKEALDLVEKEGARLRTRFAATSQAARVEAALARMKIHAQLGTGER